MNGLMRVEECSAILYTGPSVDEMRPMMNHHPYSEVEELRALERIRLTWRLFRDDRVATWMKAAVPAIAALYLVAPIDLIPDFILGLGQIDDLSIIGVALFAMTKLLPKLSPNAVTSEHLSEMRGEAVRTAPNDQDSAYVETSFRYPDGPVNEAR